VRRAAWIVVVLSVAASASARDAWLLRGYVHVELTGPRPCGVSPPGWRMVPLFHNLGDAPATVRAIETGSGGIPAADVVVPPRTSVAVPAPEPQVTETRLWMARFDLPSEVEVENRVQYLPAQNTSCAIPAVRVNPPTWQFPVFDHLTPAGTRRLHLGTDVQGNAMRINVGIYNDGDRTATATIDVHRAACGADFIAAHRTLSIEPKALAQVSIGELAICAADPIDPSMFYTAVVVDQPSLSYAMTLSNNEVPTAPVVVAAPR
jgi:hypothetical protein